SDKVLELESPPPGRAVNDSTLSLSICTRRCSRRRRRRRDRGARRAVSNALADEAAFDLRVLLLARFEPLSWFASINPASDEPRPVSEPGKQAALATQLRPK